MRFAEVAPGLSGDKAELAARWLREVQADLERATRAGDRRRVAELSVEARVYAASPGEACYPRPARVVVGTRTAAGQPGGGSILADLQRLRGVVAGMSREVAAARRKATRARPHPNLDALDLEDLDEDLRECS